MFQMELVSRTQVKAAVNDFSFVMPVCRLEGTDLHIIGFDSMGKNSLIHAVAEAFLDEMDFSEVDYIICPEAKAIPIAQELSRILKIDYFVLRKAKKAYMEKPECMQVRSITTQGVQTLWYDKAEVEKLLAGKKVVLFDDVVSTGASFRALEEFATKNQLDVSGKCAVFSEGESGERTDIKVLGYLPLLTGTELEKRFSE